MPQAEVVIYTLPGCGACLRARSLLRRRDIAFHEISGIGVARFRAMLLERTGRATVPQILIDGEPVGGASDLARLDRLGVLTSVIRRDPFPRPVLIRRFSPLRLVVSLLAAVGGGGCGPWRYEVALVDRDGRRLDSTAVGSRGEGEAVLEAMRTAGASGFDPRGALEIHGTSPPNGGVAVERDAG
jgi:glutaredoxin 3